MNIAKSLKRRSILLHHHVWVSWDGKSKTWNSYCWNFENCIYIYYNIYHESFPKKTVNASISRNWNSFPCQSTGLLTRFHKTNSKEAISMWPDMHSFYRFQTFEPIDFLFEKLITCFVLPISQFQIVRRFLDFTNSDQFWLEFVNSVKRRIKN